MTDLYPNSPGFKDRTTSRDAADRMGVRAGTMRGEIMKAWRVGGGGYFTADDIAFILGASVLAVRPRVTELYRMGLIERTGERRENESGMKAHVYRLSNPHSVG